MNNIGSAIGALTQANVIPAPVPPDYIRSLEAAVCAQLPKDYSLLLERFGAIDIPADVPIAVYDPAVICGYVASIYNMDGTIPSEMARSTDCEIRSFRRRHRILARRRPIWAFARHSRPRRSMDGRKRLLAQTFR